MHTTDPKTIADVIRLVLETEARRDDVSASGFRALDFDRRGRRLEKGERQRNDSEARREPEQPRR